MSYRSLASIDTSAKLASIRVEWSKLLPDKPVGLPRSAHRCDLAPGWPTPVQTAAAAISGVNANTVVGLGF